MKRLLTLLVLLSVTPCSFSATRYYNYSPSTRYQYKYPVPTTTTTPTTTTPSTPTTTPTTTTTTSTASANTVFQSVWESFWLKPIPAGAKYTSFRISSDPGPGFYAQNLALDVNYQVLSTSSDPQVDILQPGAWDNRDSGTIRLGRTNVPTNFILPDATSGDTPNNPVIIVNNTTKTATFLNGAARPYSGGSIWGYIANPPCTHGGSGIIGGELTAAQLNSGNINHAIAINVWAKKYLSRTNGGYVAPAHRADAGYNSPTHADYYAGPIENLKMGSRVAIPPSVTASSLGITSKPGLTLFNALKTYGAYIVDNSAWDALYINGTADIGPVLAPYEKEIAKMFAALQIVQ